MTAPSRLVVLSGGSGGGKSTLLTALADRGFDTVPEWGRAMIAEGVSPWQDPVGFLRLAVTKAQRDREAAIARGGLVFFDRSLVDVASALEYLGKEPALHRLCDAERYDRRAFLAPPWPEIYVNDEDRRHGFDRALAEYDRLARDYPALGYEVVPLPRVSVEERIAFVLDELDR
ncbi:MAG: AAA family ATPase [Pseudomonadota bacterium]|nr:AAA family ATPase [Pseudomonadota bacterium]